MGQKDDSMLPVSNQAEAMMTILVAEAVKKGVTPQQLADASGLPYSAAWKIMNGQSRRPTLEGAMAVARVVGRKFIAS